MNKMKNPREKSPFGMPPDNIPDLDTEQMIEVDRAMIEDYKIGLIQMMENAGRNLARLARLAFLEGDARNKNVVILAGSGGNGGGALVCARHLHNAGATVNVHLSKDPETFKGVPEHQLSVLQNMQVPVSFTDDIPSFSVSNQIDMIIDGLIGYSLSGAPRGRAAGLIDQANAHAAPVLSLDAPSGLDATTGHVHDPAIKADATMTLALVKRGLRQNAPVVGDLYLADISVPPGLYSKYLGWRWVQFLHRTKLSALAKA